MLRYLVFFTLCVTSVVASAAVIESEWEAVVSDKGQLAFDNGRLHFLVSHVPIVNAQGYGAYAVREWKGGYLSFAEDWTISIQVHLGSLVERPQSNLTIGVELVKADWNASFPPSPLAGTKVSYSGLLSNRFAFPLYGMGVAAADDTLLVQSYSASEQTLRTFIQLPGGPLEQFHSLDIGYYFSNPSGDPVYALGKSDPLKIRLYASSNSPTADYSLGLGDAYVDSFRVDPVAFVPEPTSIVLATSLLVGVCFKSIRRRASR